MLGHPDCRLLDRNTRLNKRDARANGEPKGAVDYTPEAHASVSVGPAVEAPMEGGTELEMVRRHVREGEGHLGRQSEVIARPQKRGTPTDMAFALLEQFADYQRQHKEHLTRLDPG